MWARIKALAFGAGLALFDAMEAYRRHRGDLLGAALAFYTLVCIAPLLVVAVAIAGIVFDEATARAEALRGVSEVLGMRASLYVAEWMDAAHATSSEATIIGGILFVFGATRVFAQLESALDVVWDVPVDPHTHIAGAVREVIAKRLFSMVLFVAFGAFVAASIVAQVMVDAAAAALFGDAPAAHALLRIVQVVLFVVVLTFCFALAFRRHPTRSIEHHETFFGAFLTALLFMLGNALLGAYFQHVDVAAAYGAAGSVVAVLVWLAYSGQIVVLGAELTRIVALRGGRWRQSRVAAASPPAADPA